MRCRNSAGPLDELCKAGRSDRPQVTSAHAQPRSSSGFTSLINDKIWAAVGLERKTLNCSWNLYHPDIRREESEEYDLSRMLKVGRQLRGGPTRNRMQRAKPYRANADRELSHLEASTSYGGAAPREAAGDGAELGSCAVCLAWCDRREVGTRPLVCCSKCKQPMHADCYSAQAGAGIARDRPAYCPEHEPLAVLDKRRADHDSSRQVRLRVSASELSSVSGSEDDGPDVLTLAVPKGARSGTGCRSRRPRIPLSVHPALPALAWKPMLTTREPADTLPCGKAELGKAESCGLDTAYEAGSNHSSPSHAACSPLHLRQHRPSQSETESVSDHDQTPPSSTARSAFSDASDECMEDTLHYKSATNPDKHTFQGLTSCAVDSRAALCHRHAVTC